MKGREWDVVIDNHTRLPQWIRNIAPVLSTAHYIFISTVSVYRDSRVPGMDETYPVRTDDSYGGRKALAEGEVLEAFGDHATIVRPGLIAGPGDDTDRFTYWPVRIARGGEVLAPGHPTDRVQIIDVRDVMEWTIRLAETKTLGTFNAVGPSMAMGDMLETIRETLGSDARFTWVPASFLAKHHVMPWSDMPAWIPPDDGERAGVGQRSNARAVAAGLTFRPLADTVRALDRRTNLRAGLTAEREAEVLAAWKG